MCKFLITFVLLFFGADSTASGGEHKQFLIQEASRYLRSLPDIKNDLRLNGGQIPSQLRPPFSPG